MYVPDAVRAFFPSLSIQNDIANKDSCLAVFVPSFVFVLAFVFQYYRNYNNYIKNEIKKLP